IIDGRYHPECSHFIAMSTKFQDCLRPNCLFSTRHAHPIACKSQACIRLMALPMKNPIRISPSKCGDCLLKTRDEVTPMVRVAGMR
ncbi:hypothetical protein DEU56DRAFT_722331, partial [Suillus clintonianus]|uniref:uncharacterized protein n=1 Tax=Suillus clintonianus TaxID=1904413 RepID=UPI001B85D80F